MSESKALRVARLTAAGRGGVASVLLLGDRAAAIAAQSLHGRAAERITNEAAGAVVVGRWRDATGEEVVVARRGDDQVEIHCHGGTAAVESIIDTLVAAGAKRVDGRDAAASLWPTRAAAEAATLLATATTERVAAILLDQLHGALARDAAAIVAMLAAGDTARGRAALDSLCQRGRLGCRLTRPFRIVIAGPPNAGKSTLVNALLGYERAIVGPLPGVTRDVLTAAAALAGWPVELADTAGRRMAIDPVEAAGVALAKAAASEADVVVAVFDGATPWSREWQPLLDDWPAADRVVIVHNKCDLERPRDDADRPPGLAVSAARGDGMAELESELARRIAPVEMPAGCGVPVVERQLAACDVARAALDEGRVDAAVAALGKIRE